MASQVTYKDIDELVNKQSLDGTEKLPVSKDEYITPNQIAALTNVSECVKYTAQTLTTEQKAQARTNIGAGTGNGTYSKPSSGIPSTDLADGVQTSLGKADTAYQKPSEGIPGTDIASGVIPANVVQYSSQSLDDTQKAQARSNIGAGTSNFSGSYSDLSNKPTIPAEQVNSDWNAQSGKAQILNKPTIPSAPGTLDTNNTQGQQTNSSEALSGIVKLHKVSKTGSYDDLLNKPTIPAAQVNADWNANSGVAQILNKPTIPSAPGTLDTTATTAQATSASEALSGSVTLHKVAKTGTYSDLIGTPTIPTVPTISTDIATDSASDDKTASPKAVADYAVQSLTTGGKKIWVGSQADYNLLTPDLTTTIYFITNA